MARLSSCVSTLKAGVFFVFFDGSTDLSSAFVDAIVDVDIIEVVSLLKIFK